MRLKLPPIEAPYRLTGGSCFSGIGGMDVAAEQAGIDVLWASEVDEPCRRVLAERFPDTKLYGDISALHGRNAQGETVEEAEASTVVDHVDVLFGGFPCQDVSVAGRRAGLAGERSGLFFEFARLTQEIRPTWVVIENVPGLLFIEWRERHGYRPRDAG